MFEVFYFNFLQNISGEIIFILVVLDKTDICCFFFFSKCFIYLEQELYLPSIIIFVMLDNWL